MNNALRPRSGAASVARRSFSAALLVGASSLASLAVAAPALAGGYDENTNFDQLSALAVKSVSQADFASVAPAATSHASALESVQLSPASGLVQPVLSLGLIGSADTVQRGVAAQFLGYSNYPGFVTRAEMRVFEAGADVTGAPHAVIDADDKGVMSWTPTTYAGDRMVVVYRVYDTDGKFDETAPETITVLSAAHVMPDEGQASRPDFGLVDAAASRSIPLAAAVPVEISGQLGGSVDAAAIDGQLLVHDPSSGEFASTRLVDANCNALKVTAFSCKGKTAETVAVSPPSGDGLTIIKQSSAEPGEQAGDEQGYAIEVRSETTHVDPVLAVGLIENERIVLRDGEANFLAYSNYPALIERAEIRLFVAGASVASQPVAIVPANQDGIASWKVAQHSPQDMFYVLRVYGADGQFDETSPQELTVLDVAPAAEAAPRRPLFGSADMAAVRTIRMKDVAKVTVTGRADPKEEFVRVAGQPVPIDETGRFVSEQIVPGDTETVLITIGNGEKTRFAAVRDIVTDREKWFVVGQGELTIGRSFASGPARQVSGDTLAEGSFAIGRAAFYAKGHVGNDWRVTASADTGEALVSDLFSNLDRKDPRQLLRRLNSEQYYPTYGDDSTLVEDAPTQGRFYLRVDNGLSQAVIGNFVAQATGTDLVQLDRGLFGALVDINSAGTTSFGERDAQLLAFASDPGTVPAREEFRGTGGSLYFLKRQDISVGSERLRIEIRDRETGLVLESRELHPREDYDIDPFNGRVTLLKPLASTADSGRTVRDGSASGNIPVLVVRYEYTPLVGDLDGYTLGARGSVWLGDTLRLGATAQRDTVEEADQTVIGADALLRVTAGTYIKAEFAQSDGPGFAQSNSVDGGLSFSEILNPGVAQAAQAWRAEAAIDLAELAKKQGNLGKFSAFYEHMDQGYAAAGRLTPTETKRWGVAAEIPLGSTGQALASYDTFTAEGRGGNTTAEFDLRNNFAIRGGTLVASAGLRYEDLSPGVLFNSTQSGERTDAAVEVEYKPSGKNWTVHGFGQATLSRDASREGNSRAGAGVTAQISDNLSLKGEVSGGDGGLGADILLNHRNGDGSESYVGYTLLADRTDTGLDSQNFFTQRRGGALVVGSRQRFSDSLSVFGENRVGIGGEGTSLSRSFGLQYSPTERISVSGTFENGRIDDPSTGEFRRTAGSLALGYAGQDFRAGSSLEVRREEGVAQTQTVWLVRSNLSYAVDPDWRFVGEVNLARSDTDGTSIRAAEFTEAVAGFAWRPVDNNRVNGLVRFHYFEDLGPVGQLTGSGEAESPKQVSAIFSADFNFELTEKLTLGARYGYRNGRVSLGRNSDEFASSEAQLAVLRADYNVLREWDVMVEGRALWLTQADNIRLGALAGVYRHLGDNVKVGVGYSWSDFSDDLTDQSYTSHGPFLNISGRF